MEADVRAATEKGAERAAATTAEGGEARGEHLLRGREKKGKCFGSIEDIVGEGGGKLS